MDSIEELQKLISKRSVDADFWNSLAYVGGHSGPVVLTGENLPGDIRTAYDKAFALIFEHVGNDDALDYDLVNIGALLFSLVKLSR